MGFVDGWLGRRRLAAIERKLGDAPRVEGFLELAEGRLAQGKQDSALDALRHGMARCLDADALLARYVALVRARRAEETRQISAAVERSPTAPDYARLIATYLELDELERAFALARAFRAELPASEAAHRVSGELHLWRWRHDLLAADGAAALGFLHAATERDRGCVRALRLLAETYIALGAGNQALRALAAIERFAPADDGTRALAKLARELPPTNGTDAQLLAAIEERGKTACDLGALATPLAERPPAASRSLQGRLPSRGLMSRALTELAALPGFVVAAWLDEAGQPIDAAAAGRADLAESWRDLFQSLLATGGDSCRLIGIGRFARGSLDGPDGAIYLARGPGYSFGAIYGAQGPRADGVWAVLDLAAGDALAEGAR